MRKPPVTFSYTKEGRQEKIKKFLVKNGRRKTVNHLLAFGRRRNGRYFRSRIIDTNRIGPQRSAGMIPECYSAFEDPISTTSVIRSRRDFFHAE